MSQVVERAVPRQYGGAEVIVKMNDGLDLRAIWLPGAKLSGIRTDRVTVYLSDAQYATYNCWDWYIESGKASQLAREAAAIVYGYFNRKRKFLSTLGET